jgi:hypothetical protein
MFAACLRVIDALGDRSLPLFVDISFAFDRRRDPT